MPANSKTKVEAAPRAVQAPEKDKPKTPVQRRLGSALGGLGSRLAGSGRPPAEQAAALSEPQQSPGLLDRARTTQMLQSQLGNARLTGALTAERTVTPPAPNGTAAADEQTRAAQAAQAPLMTPAAPAANGTQTTELTRRPSLTPPTTPQPLQNRMPAPPPAPVEERPPAQPEAAAKPPQAEEALSTPAEQPAPETSTTTGAAAPAPSPAAAETGDKTAAETPSAEAEGQAAAAKTGAEAGKEAGTAEEPQKKAKAGGAGESKRGDKAKGKGEPGPRETGKGAAGGAGAAEEKAAPTRDPRQAIAPAAGAVRSRAAGARRHSPPARPVGSAQAAARNPETEQSRAAAQQTVENIDAAGQDAQEIERQAFKNKLKEAIERATPEPKTESQAEEVMESGATNASATLRGELQTERAAAAGPMQTAANPATAPAPTVEPPPPQTDLEPEEVGPAPEPVSAASVVPEALPASQLDYSSDSDATDQMMADNNVTTEQLERGNEPAFAPALDARSEAEEHEAAAEPRYRESEAAVQQQARGHARRTLTAGVTGFQEEREGQIGQVVEQQTDTQSKNAAERQRITDTINGIKAATQEDVTRILDEMETEANSLFESGLQKAEKAYADAFEEAKGGIGTWLTTWGDDWTEHIENSLATARRVYLREVDKAIDQVADLVAAKLTAARKRVADGRKQVEEFVAGLGESVKQFGEDALAAVSADFDAMENQINERRDSLVNGLVDQYRQSYERMSAMEEELRNANKSLWQRVYDATVGLIEKIIEFKNMLLGILAQAADAIEAIIDDPIGFLGNLIDGVSLGLNQFTDNIGTHLQEGLIAWLTGTLGEAGITLPETWDLAGIFDLVMQILGVSFDQIMGKLSQALGFDIMAIWETIQDLISAYQEGGIGGLARYGLERLIGPEKMAMLMEVIKIVQLILSGDFGQLWEVIKGHLATLKEMIFAKITEFLVEKVIKAGITWVLSLFNPASAFIRACMMIYDVVMFFVERAEQIKSLIEAVTSTIMAIARGDVGALANAVENALARAIPVAISFLASLLGLGGVADKVRETIESIRAMVDSAIDSVVNSRPVKAVAGFIQRAVAKVKSVASAGLERAKSAVGLGKKEEGEERTPETGDPEHDAKVDAGLMAIDTEEQRRLEAGEISRDAAEEVAAKVRREHPVFRSIKVVDGGKTWNYDYVASPGKTKTGEPKLEDTEGSQRPDNWKEAEKVRGKPVGVPLPAGYEYYERNTRQFIRRLDADDKKFQQLGVSDDGLIVFGRGRSPRISDPAEVTRSVGPADAQTNRHHLIPDAEVRRHALTKEAMARGEPKYIGANGLDAASNLIRLPSNEEGKKLFPNLPMHRGSHPKWSKLARDRLTLRQVALVRTYGSLSKVPGEILTSTLRSVEIELRGIIVTWRQME